jgi:D-xylose 1-dehydrogenase (NADP+, D-xylono-1,5-lactone-forming)
VTVRWGFIGAGYVASRAMAPAVHVADNAELYAVASRDRQRSETLEPKVVHDSYQDLIDDPHVDAVYISLTNVQHKQWVLTALEAGKHVLCEKPLAMNADEVRLMMEAAERNKRLLVEAVWTRWQPRMQRMAEVVRNGDLGDVVNVSSSFTFQGDLTNNYRSDPVMGGGALLDVGGYQVHLWLMLFGETSTCDITSVERTIGPTGIDLTTSVQARLNINIDALALSSFDLAPQQTISLQGTHSSMHTGEGEAFTFWKQRGTLIIGDTVEVFEPSDAFAIMVEEVSTAILQESAPLFPGDSSVRVAEVIDQVSRFNVSRG